VKISFTCLVDTYKLALHSRLLDINNSSLQLTSLTDSAFAPMSNFKYMYDSITHILTVDLGNQMFRANNNYTFSASFRGYTRDDNMGFFRSSYFDSNGNRRWLITSQMEYIEARKSFICFDEPGYRSKFKLTITHDSSVTSMSNMPVKAIRNM
jgi:aminopeptidase N